MVRVSGVDRVNVIVRVQGLLVRVRVIIRVSGLGFRV